MTMGVEMAPSIGKNDVFCVFFLIIDTTIDKNLHNSNQINSLGLEAQNESSRFSLQYKTYCSQTFDRITINRLNDITNEEEVNFESGIYKLNQLRSSILN